VAGLLRRMLRAAFPPPIGRTEEEQLAAESRLALLLGGDRDLAGVESRQARVLVPENPLGRVSDLYTAFRFVQAEYPPHQTPDDLALAQLFALLVQHVARAYRDPQAGLPPRPQLLDGILATHNPWDLIVELRESPVDDVRADMARLLKTEGHLQLQAAFAQLQRRYGRRWVACP